MSFMHTFENLSNKMFTNKALQYLKLSYIAAPNIYNRVQQTE